ncbi:MAG: hypothetical protein IKY52_14725 [Clostridia bacterium]|nr:hypothetical protein [Clostridia bacterium]
MNTQKRIALFLAALFSLSAMTACGNTAEETTADTAAVQETEETAAPSIFDGYDYGGKVLRIFSSINEFDSTNAHHLIAGSGETNGEIVNDAVFNRNAAVEEGLNIKLEFTPCDWNYGENTDGLSQIVMAGEDLYDVIINDVLALVNCAKAGYLRTIREEYLSMDSSWWYAEAMECLEVIPGVNFYLMGDFFADCLNSAHVLYYNKDVILDNYGDSGYVEDLIFEGNWTIDEVMSIMETCAVDTNGDGTYKEGDLMGFYVDGLGSLAPMMGSLGVEYLKEGADGSKILDFNTEHSVKVAEKISELYNSPYFITKSFGYAEERIQFFANRNTVIMGYQRLGDLQRMRDIEFDVGIAVYPKLDTAQESYRTNLHDTTEIGGLLATVPDGNLEFIYTCLDFLSRTAAESVIPVWYEEALKVKYSSGSEEAQMIDLIRDTIDNPFYVFYSPALKYNVIYTFLNCASSKTLDFASSYAKNDASTQSAYQALIAGYQAAVDAGM